MTVSRDHEPSNTAVTSGLSVSLREASDALADKMVEAIREALSKEEPSRSRRCEATCAGKEELDTINTSQPKATGATQ